MAFFNKGKIKQGRIPIPDIPPYIPPVPPEPEIPEEGETPVTPIPSITGGSTITLYHCNDENNKVVKNLSGGIGCNAFIVLDCDVSSPVIELESGVSLIDYNYAYIDTTNRYYYVKVVCMPQGFYRLYLTIDVLMSYANSIKNLSGIIDKEETTNDLYINDGTFVHGVKDYTRVYNFASGFNDTPDNILICAGGE